MTITLFTIFLCCACLTSATIPTFTWQVDGDFTACNTQPSCVWDSTKESYKGFQYYHGIGITSCTCIVFPDNVNFEYIMSGTQTYDSSSVFSYSSPPLDCDAGNDGNLDCIKASSPSNALYQSDWSSYTFTSQVSVYELSGGVVYPAVQITTGSSNWKVEITTSGTPYVWDGTLWHSLYNAVGYVQTASVGYDGTLAYIQKLGGVGGRPVACQLSNANWGTCSGNNYLGDSSAFCLGIDVLDAKNIICWNGVPYFLDGGYPLGSWGAISSWPSGTTVSHDCDSSSPKSYLSRPDIADVNPSRGDGQAYVTLRDTNGATHGAHFTKVT